MLSLHRLYFERPQAEDLIPLQGETLDEVRRLLRRAGYQVGEGPAYDAGTRASLAAYFQTENFEERWSDQPFIDQKVLAYMRDHLSPEATK
ncbi:putative peptidoglycan binding domain-containing protein [Alicyclobacillus cellulosilyticus]|uniref:putative peptidoglycan binding domain-containing protein n=1 Tax=Alicyclobacillus cellulosilyticus TaxID=1003997 RepID=UPI0027E482A1|nr:putative peptidoglycan binding domain-containing protein [Alicyclobacillus cellulosilyticus]